MTFGFSGALLRFTSYQREMKVEASTLGEALAALTQQLPALQPVLYDATGAPRAVHRLFLNGEQLLTVELSRPLASGDRIDVLTAIAGG